MLRYRRHGIARTLRAVWKRRAFAYGAALCSVIAATLLALPLYPDDADFPALLLLAAVGVSAALGGFGPAIIATIGGFVSLDYFFEYPPYSLTIQALGTSLDLLMFVFVAVLLGTLNARLRAARQRTNIARQQAEAALQARDEALAIVSHDLR